MRSVGPRIVFVGMAVLSLACSTAFASDASLLSSQFTELEKLIKERPDDFAGISIDEDRHIAVLRHSAISDPNRLKELLAKLRRAPRQADERPWSVELKSVAHSQRQLDWAFDRVLQVEPWATLVKPVLAGWEMDVEKNVVAVNVTAMTPELREAARRTFGPTVELRLVAGRGVQYSRSNDFPPWFGGIPIQGLIPDPVFATDIALCTAGFSVSDPGGTFTGLVTAGHCFDQGASITQPSDKERVGAILARENKNMGLDWAFIGFGESYGNNVWITSTSSLLVNDPTSPNGFVTLPVQVGTKVCLNGAKTGERCNAKITSLNSCQALDLIIFTCKVVTVKSTDGTRIAQRGDSGGPVYRKMSGVAVAEGIILGGNGSAGTTVFYQSINHVLAALAVHPFVGGFGPWHLIGE